MLCSLTKFIHNTFVQSCSVKTISIYPVIHFLEVLNWSRQSAPFGNRVCVPVKDSENIVNNNRSRRAFSAFNKSSAFHSKVIKLGRKVLFVCRTVTVHGNRKIVPDGSNQHTIFGHAHFIDFLLKFVIKDFANRS